MFSVKGPGNTKRSRLQSTLLLIEFMLRGIKTVWTVKSSVEWDRQDKTISLIIQNLDM